MAKYNEITDRYNETLKRISESKEEWSSFLDFAARFSKYDFKDVALIYAQRPDATACAGIDVWNKKMNCWVKRGSKGIALIDDTDSRGLRYVFDVSDVTPDKNIGRLPNPWVFNDLDTEDILTHLEKMFISFRTEDGSTIDDIISLGKRLSETASESAVSILKDRFQDSLDIPEDVLKIKVEDFLSSSFSHIVLERLSIPREYWENRLNYSYLSAFSNADVLGSVGDFLTGLTMPVLSEIGRVVIRNEIARREEMQYNENEEDKENGTISNERATEEGADTKRFGVHGSERISSSESRDESTTGGGIISSRTDAEDVAQREPTRTIFSFTNARGTETALSGRSETSDGNAELSDRENGERGGSDRSAQEIGSNGLGSQNELNQDESAGDSAFGRNPEIDENQLSFFPSLEEQMGEIVLNAASATPSDTAFSFEDNWVDTVLRSGSDNTNSLSRIYSWYKLGREDIEELLEKEFNGTCKGFHFNNEPYAIRFDNKGMIVSKGTSTYDKPKLFFITYSAIKDRIENLIKNDEFVDKSIADSSLDIVREDLASKIFFLFRNGFDKYSDEIGMSGSFPDSTEKTIELLKTKDGRRKVNNAILSIAADYFSDGGRENYFIRAFREDWDKTLPSLDNEVLDLPHNASLTVPTEDFITQDTIDDEIIKHGNSVEHHKRRIYKFFTDANKTLKEKADFLSKEYGTGGRAGMPFNTWYDPKGFKLQKGRVLEPYAGVFLKWPVIAKRLDELIKEGRYLSEDELKEWKSEENLKKEVLFSISEYLKEEFDNTDEEIAESIKYTHAIPIAYSTDGNDTEIQVYADLERHRLKFEIGGPFNSREIRMDSLEELYDRYLNPPDFSELISLGEDFIEESKDKHEENEFEGITEDIMEEEQEETGIIEEAEEGIEIIDFAVGYSEHPCFYGIPVDNMRAEGLSFALGNKLLGILDTKVNNERDFYDDLGGYYKTDFFLKLKVDGEEVEYKGRYDLGDGHEDLVNHIKLFQEYMLDPNNGIMKALRHDNGEEAYKEQIETSRVWLDRIIPFLETQKDTTDAEEERLSEILSTENDWWSRKRLEFIPEDARIYGEANNTLIEVTSSELEKIKDAGISDDFIIYDNVSPDHKDYTIVFNIEKSLDILHAIDTIHDIPEELEVPEEVEETPLKEAPNSNNFVITDDNLGAGTKQEKIANNLQAIRLLKSLEENNEIASPDSKETLSKYVGWGGIPEIFEEGHKNYTELKELLTEDEWQAAASSTLNAHYTSPTIIRSMYKALERLGFKKGNILEPAMGIGNFFGMLPEEMKESNLYGVELDSISGRIAKMLYPDAKIHIKGFEDVDDDIPDNFFDVVVGNVPFGEYGIYDRNYNKENFNIHDYFISKSLEKVKPGGVVCVITSKGTMDKLTSSARKSFARRAELLGAIRLPNDAFKQNAGTEVTSDILILKKRERALSVSPSWVDRGMRDEDNMVMNTYFIEHPEMVLGNMVEVSGRYGTETTCEPKEGVSLESLLEDAISNLGENVLSQERVYDLFDEDIENSIPAPENVKNYTYVVIDNELYFRTGSIMVPQEVSESKKNRIIGMINLRDAIREIIKIQMDGEPDEIFEPKREEINRLYDNFVKKYGYIQSQPNRNAFSDDESYYLLASLEEYNEDNEYVGKADIFTKRTIRPKIEITHVETPHEALALSLANKAKVDLSYMAELTDLTEESIVSELSGVVFSVPETHEYVTADEYLSGNVRKKLEVAKEYAENNPEYLINVEALSRVQPEDLSAQDIDIRLGATWIPEDIIMDFLRETLKPSAYLVNYGRLAVKYDPYTAQWNIDGKKSDYTNSLVTTTYGTSRMNGYEILEKALNLRECKVYDKVRGEDGKEKSIINAKETTLATQKKEALCDAFRNWIYQDMDRRERLCKIYNEKFNSHRAREYSGEFLTFPGMSNEIELKDYQKNAIARQLYGGNTLLAHCVGAGKTYEMATAAMEMKRLGLCSKSLFVVPNALVSQWASMFLRLYPDANILAAGPKDLSASNRKRFCSRIATGDYDAIIIPQSQFSMIPLSADRQIDFIQDEIDNAIHYIESEKYNRGERFTIKQMEATKKRLEKRLQKLLDSRKDDVVTFEELGVDRLFVDESHNFKNLSTVTKLGNVPGISTSESKKSEDLLLKCRYLNEITGNKGVIFGTGTPISNSMTELYTNMRYLEPDKLEELGLSCFDAWASTFGEIITAIELSPEGGYRSKRRFAKFHNLPELMTLFKEVADIQTQETLKLPIPEAIHETIVLKPSEIQKKLVKSFGERAERIRNTKVDPTQDNMLKVTTDGRKAALDQRIIHPELAESEESKTGACAGIAYDIYLRSKDISGTQLIFSDLATPSGALEFNVYDDIKNKLIEKGVPEEEIAFIHDYDTPAKKNTLFNQVNAGKIRFLLGSTVKLGTGTNVQQRLVALHHLDVPWRPSDIEQREGRILRRGNMNEKAEIYKYVTEATFDSYSWQMIENKQKFIGQVMTSKSPVRSCADIDETALSYAEVKALAAGNPLIKEKMELDIEVAKLKLARSSYEGQKYNLQRQISQEFPARISKTKEYIKGYTEDIERYHTYKPAADTFFMKVNGLPFDKAVDAGNAIKEAMKDPRCYSKQLEIGEFSGFKMLLSFDAFDKVYRIDLKGTLSHRVELGSDAVGNIQRIKNKLDSLDESLKRNTDQLAAYEQQLETAKVEVERPFAQEEEFREKNARLHELDAILAIDKDDGEVLESSEEKDGVDSAKIEELSGSYKGSDDSGKSDDYSDTYDI